MKKILCLLACLLVTVSCSKKIEDETITVHESEVIVTNTPSVEISKEQVPIVLDIQLVDDVNLIKDKYVEFKDFELNASYQYMVLIKTNTEIKDFKIVEIQMINDTLKFDVPKVLYDKALTVDEPILYCVTISETIPSRGIMYTDIDGNEVCFSLNISGKDGSIHLVKEEVVGK